MTKSTIRRATSKDSDQPVQNPCHTGLTYRLIRIFAGHTSLIIGFVVCWLIFLISRQKLGKSLYGVLLELSLIQKALKISMLHKNFSR